MPKAILATDCGSTTTKAILIEHGSDGWRLIARGEAPTTVEAPFDDVTVGVTNALRELEEVTEKTFLDANGKPLISDDTYYLSTSSAGGGLQMTVAGVVKEMSAESAERAALGAGAIVIDTLAINDGRKEFEKVERIRSLRPDMILMAGGTDDGNMVPQVQEIAETLRSADPRPRLGIGLKLPIIFAGSEKMRTAVEDTLGDLVSLKHCENVRPTLDSENLGPAREAVHELFLEHVMQQAPGYGKLKTWTSADILSTPNAVGYIMETIARQRGISVLGVDIGGATTDVFSVFSGVYTRTVSANLGMSYSICNVLTEAGLENIQRWLPFEATDAYVRNQLRNKMIRPTTIPQQLKDLHIEQAASREALRLAFEHHKSLAREMVGVQQQRSVGDLFDQQAGGRTRVDMLALNMLIGSGGVLAHAPELGQTVLMMLDAYQPEGLTTIAKDSIFMMPQLGILSTLLPEAATQVFERDCLIRLAECIAPIGTAAHGAPCLTAEWGSEKLDLPFGTLRLVPIPGGQKLEVRCTPASGFDLGAGKGRSITFDVVAGELGIVFDCRGRPIAFPSNSVTANQGWLDAMVLPI